MTARSALRGLFLLTLASALTASAAGAPFRTAERSVSGSQRFYVFGQDKIQRQEIAGTADEIRAVVLDELGLNISANTPIIITINHWRTTQPGVAPADLEWIITDAGPQVKLTLRVSDNADSPSGLQEQIIQAVLLTEKFRENPPEAGAAYTSAPAWLVEGISEKVRLRKREPDASIYRGLMNMHVMPDLQDFLADEPEKMNGAELGMYRAYSCALVNLLQDLPGGKRALLTFLKQAPADRSAQVKLLFKTYPQINTSPSSLEKWWTLSLAKLSAADRYTALTAAETDQELTRALNVTLDDATAAGNQEFTLEQFPEFIKSRSRKSAMKAVQWELIRLSVRANPLFRPILNAYRDAAYDLGRGKTRGMEEKLTSLAELRQQILQRVDEVADYLNWMEVTQLPGQSHDFDSYMRLSSQLQNPVAKQHTDPIGKYLDAVEYELQ